MSAPDENVTVLADHVERVLADAPNLSDDRLAKIARLLGEVA